MISQYFLPCIVGRSNSVKVVLDLSGYLRKDGTDYFKSKHDFQEEGTQEYLIFYPSCKYFRVENGKTLWKSKEVSNEEITSITADKYSSVNQYLPKLIADNEK